MSETPRDCKHGHLARSCDICGLEAELTAMTAERDKLQAALAAAANVAQAVADGANAESEVA